MSDMDPIDTFINEANEHLTLLEEVLMEMEEQPDDEELIAQAFRSMHTIKGAGGMFGFDDLSAFTHHLETAFDKVRNGQYPVTPDLISVILDSKDHIATLLEDVHQTPAQSITGDALLERLSVIIPDESNDSASSSDVIVEAIDDVENAVANAFRIRIVPTLSAFADGFDAKPMLRELQSIGECQLTTCVDTLPALSDLDPETCLLHWDIILNTTEDENAIADTFIFVQDEWKIEIEKIDINDEDEQSDQLGSILIDRGSVTPSQINDALSAKPKMGELLQDAGLVTEQQVSDALVEQEAVRTTKKKQKKEQETNVRVPTGKLDSMMDLVGELVIVQARLNQLALDREDEEILTVSEDLDRLTTDLRDNTFDIRMLPIGTTFSRFRRLVRDLSRDLGKEIQLVTEGADTELDKMVIDSLADPMVHLIRNSIDHGIESPEQREAAGKPRKGTILLSAEHAESQVVIRIKDDGGSLNAEKLKDKAIEKGILQADNRLTDEEAYNLIFAAGFSTAEVVSDVSGRGVGMDVVKRSIQALRGDVEIACDPGVSTTITIRLPMTLAIIEGLMVGVSGERYVLPLSSVEECIELSVDNIEGSRNDRLVEIRGELVPYVRLREWFNVAGDAPEIEQVVVVNIGDNHFGFSVDEVIGQYQTVIKSLGKFYEGVQGIAGATILGDGGVAMILDIPRLTAAIEAEPTVLH